MIRKVNLSLFFLSVLLFSCFERQDEIITIVNPGPVATDLPQENDGLIFIDENGEEYWMGSDNSFCYGLSTLPSGSDQVLTGLVIPDVLETAYDLSDFLPPIGNQGSIPSCVAWATTYYMGSLQYNFYLSNGAPQVVLSPSYVYNQLVQGECKGTEIAKALDILQDQGACDFDLFPYQTSNCSEQPGTAQQDNALDSRISDYKLLSGENMVNEVKALLSVYQTSVVVSMGLDGEFGKRDDMGISAYRPHPVNLDEIYGAHAMLVVGYSDRYNAFKLANSWGPSWGDSGFVWVDYAAFDNLFDPNNEFKVLCSAYVADW